MWLPRDERRLLSGYYRAIGTIHTAKWYRVAALGPFLKSGRHRGTVPEYGDARQRSDDKTEYLQEYEKWLMKHLDETCRIEKANKHLSERGLIVLERHEHETDVVGISLTLDGYDLGRKVSGWLPRSGLWFEEYRNHWLWLIAACFGATIVSKLLESLW